MPFGFVRALTIEPVSQWCVFHSAPPVYIDSRRKTKAMLHIRRWTTGATRWWAASRCNPQVPWFPCLGEAWVGRSVPARLCVCRRDGCWQMCASLSQLWGLTSGATRVTMCPCMNCWAWAVPCSAWCTRCWGRSTRSPSWPRLSSSASAATSSHGRGIRMELVWASRPVRNTNIRLQSLYTDYLYFLHSMCPWSFWIFEAVFDNTNLMRFWCSVPGVKHNKPWWESDYIVYLSSGLQEWWKNKTLQPLCMLDTAGY